MRRREYYGTPITGPICVEGAEPADTSVVRLLDQQCDTLGYTRYRPFLFHSEDFLQSAQHRAR
jgi:acetamidase/formamidase